MKFHHAVKEKGCPVSLPFLFFLSLLLWIISFRGFLSGELSFISDAKSYLDHTKFYTDNLLRGVYPLWDPTWNYGIPNEFFLRRIGSFNPCFALILLLDLIKIPHTFSYLIFLTFYYFIGAIGFYLLARRFFRDTRLAFASFLLLMFSSLGTRLFDSYIILTFVPLVWFFFFFFAFSESQERRFFVGMVFALMNLITTYIPFYFLTIFLSFLICFLILYFRDLRTFFFRYLDFVRNNRILVVLCIFVLLLTVTPGFLFYLEADKGDLVLPRRHYNYSHTPAPSGNQMEVDIQNITKWGIAEEIVYSEAFSHSYFHRFKFALFYIPIFAYILLFCGIFTRINKRLVLLFVWGCGLFMICSPHFPIHGFFYKHVFYFKYFRNLHFFLWLALLPIFILFVVEQFRLFMNYAARGKKEKYTAITFFAIIHAAFAVTLYLQRSTAFTSYGVVGFSFLFFMLCVYGWLQVRKTVFLFLFLVLITAQPLEAYHYLNKNALKTDGPYRYDQPYLHFSFLKKGMKKPIIREEDFIDASGTVVRNILRTPLESGPLIYIGTKWFHSLSEGINNNILNEYARHRFIVYDHVEWIEDNNLDLNRIARSFLEEKNVAFISSEKAINELEQGPAISSPHPQKITENSARFQVLDYNVNAIKLKTHFDVKKFLVYNDNFHSGWQAFVNEQRVDLFRANVAFKGVWLAPGENIVTLRFGTRWRYFLELFLLGTFYSIFLYLIYSWWKSLLSGTALARDESFAKD